MSCFKTYTPVYWKYSRNEITYKEFLAELDKLDSLRGKQSELFEEEKKK